MLPSGSFDLPILLALSNSERTTHFHIEKQNLFDLSTRKVYHAAIVTNSAVSSYLAISPLPRQVGAVCFLLHFLSPTSRCLPVRKYGALCCPDFPPRIIRAIRPFALFYCLLIKNSNN